MCENFPDGNIINLEIRYPDACYVDNWCGIHLIIEMDEKEINQYEASIKSFSKESYSFNESCFDIINYEKNINTPVILKTCDSTTKIHLPVTNFAFCFEKLPKKDFYVNSSIYIINAEEGIFLEKENLSNGVGLKCGWQNGYSKGVLINSKLGIVYFWLEVW